MAWQQMGLVLILVAGALLVVLLAENARIPVDDPNTHLELTMIHEVMVLDYSGPDLAFILYGAALKLFILSALLVRLVLPLETGSAWLDWPLFVAALLGGFTSLNDCVALGGLCTAFCGSIATARQ